MHWHWLPISPKSSGLDSHSPVSCDPKLSIDESGNIVRDQPRVPEKIIIINHSTLNLFEYTIQGVFSPQGSPSCLCSISPRWNTLDSKWSDNQQDLQKLDNGLQRCCLRNRAKDPWYKQYNVQNCGCSGCWHLLVSFLRGFLASVRRHLRRNKPQHQL